MTTRRARLIQEFESAQPKWLSLDVFDTLLCRPFERPTDLFVEIHRALQQAGEPLGAVTSDAYLRRRIEAERAARQCQPTGEVTVDEVCEELSRTLGGSPCSAALIAAEVATEQKFIQLDPDIAALVRHAHERGVPYMLVSDMYLRGAHILALLNAAVAASGQELPMPAHVFVSGERRTNKGGRLFDEILQELGAAPSDILHIGDHEHSDFASPLRRGIHAFHYHRETPYLARILDDELRHLPGWARSHYDVGLRTIRSKAVTSAQSRPGEPINHFQYGAFVLGPILTLFAEWVVQDCVRNAQPAVHCLMREGHLLAPLIERAARASGVALEVHKLWASRYAIRGASYHHGNEPELRGYFVKRHSVPLASVARDLGLDLPTLRAATGIEHGTALTAAEIDRIVRAVVGSAELREQMVEASAEKRRRLFSYYQSAGVFARDRLTLVDVGWGGTIQATLARVFHDLPRPNHLRGLYLATHEKLLELPVSSCSADSFLFQLGYPKESCDILRRSPEILEHSCMPEFGSFREIDEDGSIVTFPQPIPSAQLQQIAEMQAGIMHFAELWLPGARKRRRDLSHHDWNCILERLRAALTRSLQNPTLEEVQLFAAFQHDNNDGSAHTEPLLGSEELRERARFMTYDQIMQLSWLECFWPQGLACLVGKSAQDSSKLMRAALRYPAFRSGASLVSRSAAAVSRVLAKSS